MIRIFHDFRIDTETMNPLRIRDVELGADLPKICVPVTGRDEAEILSQMDTIRRMPFDLIEWRADFFTGMYDSSSCAHILALFRENFKNTPLLFTIRTANEGGEADIATGVYEDLIRETARTGLADLVDVELSRGDDVLKRIVADARDHGCRVIASCHNFSSTPSKESLVNTLCRMQDLGADIAKYAVMPQSDRDVLTLLDASLTMKESHRDTPVITMSMGPQGAVSRICGKLSGSCLTFGTAGAASAPGQIPADTLKEFLEILG